MNTDEIARNRAVTPAPLPIQPRPPELPYLPPDYRYGDHHCAVCLVWVGGFMGINDGIGNLWHRLFAGHW